MARTTVHRGAALLLAVLAAGGAAAQTPRYRARTPFSESLALGVLVNYEGVKRDLGLTPAQEKALGAATKPFGPRMGRLTARAPAFNASPAAKAAHDREMGAWWKDFDRAVLGCLLPRQAARLRSLQLQGMGYTAFYGRKLQTTLGLAAGQVAGIEAFRKADKDRWLKALLTNNDPKDAAGLSRKMRGLNLRGQERMEALLTPAQKRRYKALLGPPLPMMQAMAAGFH